MIVVNNATINNDTATVAGMYTFTVTDGSGNLTVQLDPKAVSVPQPPATNPYVPGSKFNIVGLLVPTSTPGVWMLKPRASSDLTKL
jgi:hypothetical protein